MNFRTLTNGVALATLGMGFVPGIAAAETFSLWVRSDGSEFMPPLVEAFNAAGAHQVNLQIVPVDELVQRYAIASAGGSAPDALSLDLIYTPAFAEAGQLRDLTDFAQSLPYFNELSPAHLSVGTVGDQIYGVPFSGDASFLLWNKDLYEQAGLDPEKGPETWAEIREHAEAVSALGAETYGFYFSGNCGGCNIFTFAPLIWATDGDLLADNGRTATLDSDEVVAAIAFYRGMANDNLVPAGAQTDSGSNFFAAFANGNIGISPSGSFAIGALNNNYPDLNYGVTFLPGQESGQFSSFAGGDNFVISARTDDSKIPAIEAFIEFAYSLEGQKILVANGAVPVRGDLAGQVFEGLDERYLVSAEAMANGRTPYSTVFNDIINSRNGPWITTLNRAFFAQSEEEMMQAVADGQAEMQAIIDAAP
ncbi:sugar ABC transporter substrate-binding protein [Roseinatronobacter sp. S2]|uniref:ABC transporter substrate-binding protein n=1 Tax=Roseinatronobacter sp. S2 TaxID=3035471 RepID=UPI00240F0D65|nr:sugar ABC transporter substrate-binding protein [Roseinatronobacter sp. S2]WFE76668.1 sugar ABC transporter substrate-binding protein [Roseinatronobacter sp. S2]